ncbi:UDP-N-acetylmuramoyl-L-alanyl-D-glutamate--2,6-diaminopimelate ligase [Aquabacterium fontiphilum]|jgi:UDP-N-acetylmuramyl-tripeptide synthetase|uniref:UDP-N-acetylmuramoyl-L-alanyl-D-glutamate--2, 6-diaminopimelate ligase n=1 Tax=Aquabacterium fontiphilum TaxID=450365 RepID=UPI0013782BE3|nr:UDP-N-acetylmuramoyl-L-alanyl-D-glutamate--2,6-diaminopimelate ligase [Aquabacterium fontiphilum]NBD20856.1 UDP-N-acetylmuramoyl-L-alanyl-D-glutamate--2,6-diaminopimelate ligase [Aquabacterium fontiphilum]
MAALHLLHDTAEVLRWLASRGVRDLVVDSRRVRDGAQQAFVAWPGAAQDGRAFVGAALAAGATACLVEAEGAEVHASDDPRVAAVPGLKRRCAEIAHGFYGEPSAHLDVVAVTGTNGKTSTSWWTAQALDAVDTPCGVVGTLGVGRAGHTGFEATGFTTPDPVTLQATFQRFVREGLRAAAIEASSIGIEELRLHATRIAVAQFTNFTQDHLDYHGTMDAYWRAKRALFNWPGLRAAVLNADDPQGLPLAAELAAQGLSVWTYGLRPDVRLQACELHHRSRGIAFTVVERDADLRVLAQAELAAPVIGSFNVSNLLAVLGALRALGHDLATAVRACAGLHAVPGRMQTVDSPDAAGQTPLVVVDYAHTPDALEKALEALQPVAQARSGRLVCVFGCGGDRDPVKRPLMGRAAEQRADRVLLTSDNPRSEDPLAILQQIRAGLSEPARAAVVPDRRDAIARAVGDAAVQDVVLIAGKGHETYQEVAGVRTLFSDVDEARAALAQWRGGAA